MSNTQLDSEAFLERTLKKMDDCDYETALKDINVGIELDPNDAGQSEALLCERCVNTV